MERTAQDIEKARERRTTIEHQAVKAVRHMRLIVIAGGYSICAWAAASGIDRRNIHRAIRGEQVPTLRNLGRMADGLYALTGQEICVGLSLWADGEPQNFY